MTDYQITREFTKWLRHSKIPYQNAAKQLILGDMVIQVQQGYLIIYSPKSFRNAKITQIYNIHYINPYISYNKLLIYYRHLGIAYPDNYTALPLLLFH